MQSFWSRQCRQASSAGNFRIGEKQVRAFQRCTFPPISDNSFQMIYQHTPRRGVKGRKWQNNNPKTLSTKLVHRISLFYYFPIYKIIFSEDPTYTFRGGTTDHLLRTGLKMFLACLSDVKLHLVVMSWGLKHLCRVVSVLAYYKDQTVLADKKKKKSFLIWFCAQWANSNESVAKLLNTFNKAGSQSTLQIFTVNET